MQQCGSASVNNRNLRRRGPVYAEKAAVQIAHPHVSICANYAGGYLVARKCPNRWVKLEVMHQLDVAVVGDEVQRAGGRVCYECAVLGRPNAERIRLVFLLRILGQMVANMVQVERAD